MTHHDNESYLFKLRINTQAIEEYSTQVQRVSDELFSNLSLLMEWTRMAYKGFMEWWSNQWEWTTIHLVPGLTLFSVLVHILMADPWPYLCRTMTLMVFKSNIKEDGFLWSQFPMHSSLILLILLRYSKEFVTHSLPKVEKSFVHKIFNCGKILDVLHLCTRSYNVILV